MKYLKQQNGQLIEPPKYDKQTGLVNCHLNVQWLTNHGFTQFTDQQINQLYEVSQTSTETDKTAFNNACEYFVEICREIGYLIQDYEFKGGYDDILRFYAHESYKTERGLQLAIAWSGCNDLCKYQANKIGLKSPEWWYVCWENAKQPKITLQEKKKTITSIVNQFINYQIQFTTNGQQHTLKIVDGQLPNGLTMSNNGIISGYIDNANTYNFSVEIATEKERALFKMTIIITI